LFRAKQPSTNPLETSKSHPTVNPGRERQKLTGQVPYTYSTLPTNFGISDQGLEIHSADGSTSALFSVQDAEAISRRRPRANLIYQQNTGTATFPLRRGLTKAKPKRQRVPKSTYEKKTGQASTESPDPRSCKPPKDNRESVSGQTETNNTRPPSGGASVAVFSFFRFLSLAREVKKKNRRNIERGGND